MRQKESKGHGVEVGNVSFLTHHKAAIRSVTWQPVNNRNFGRLGFWWQVHTKVHFAPKFHTTDITSTDNDAQKITSIIVTCVGVHTTQRNSNGQNVSNGCSVNYSAHVACHHRLSAVYSHLATLSVNLPHCLPCASSLTPSILHLSHGVQCSPTLNCQPYEERLPLTSWWRKSSNMTVGQSSLISLTHHCYDWQPGSRCG